MDFRRQETGEQRSIRRSVNTRNSFIVDEEKQNLKRNLKYLNKHTTQFMSDLNKLLDQNFNFESLPNPISTSLIQDEELSSIFVSDNKK